jgi:transposase
MSHRESEDENKSNATWFAEHIGVSRATLYNVYNTFKEHFQNEPPGRKPTPQEKVVEHLQEELRKKEEEFEILEQLIEEQTQQVEEEKKRRVVATLLQAAVSPMSTRGTRDLLETAFGVRLSKRKIKNLIAEYSNKAREILEKMDLEKYVEILAIDEVFAGPRPILTGVDVKSFAVLICKKETSRTHIQWCKVLGPFPHLKLVVSDKATGIIKAVRLRCEEMSQLRHQFDLFHFKRDVGRRIRQLEAWAYRKIEIEYKSERQLGKAKTEEQRRERRNQYQKHKEEAAAAIEIYDGTEQALIKIFKSMEIFDESGNFNDLSKNLKHIEKENAKLMEIAGTLPEKSTYRKKIDNISKQLQDPRLLLYLSLLEINLLDIMFRWKAQGISRKDAVKILCEHWYWKTRGHKKMGIHSYRKRLVVLLQMRQLQMALANFDEVYSQVSNALYAACRASSLVESFNSQVRVFQQVKKGLHKNFLYLVALKWNMTPFEEGKRKGKSPCELLGVPLSSNWIDLLLST